jgi:D-alanyl-D-alanine dipeptidase
MSPILLVTAVGRGDGLVEAAAIEAMSAARPGRETAPLLIEVAPLRRRSPTVLATRPAKDLEGWLQRLGPDVKAVARGGLCVALLDVGADPGARIVEVLTCASEALPGGETAFVIACPPASYRPVVEALAGRIDRVLMVCPPQPGPTERALLEIAMAEADEVAGSVEVLKGPPGRIPGRRALAGSRPRRGPRGEADLDAEPPETGAEEASPGSPHPRHRLFRARMSGERAQATPLVLGAVFALVAGAVVLVAIAGAITGKGEAQRAADLSALSAARSMKDDLPRLLAPPTLPNGLPNPAHMPKPVYLARARLTAVRIATANGASPLTVSVRFPDALSFAPVTARVSIRIAATGSGPADPVWAKARVGAPVAMGAVPAFAAGGGYSGPLAERQGYGMRPDVAVAFDRLVAAASSAGVTVVINSAFRSDAEQAVLFAANPDPHWVAPPGTSLHRCGTELDMGPASAYGWLAANAGRFGFVKRYSWEPWHFGFSAGPEPCSQAGNRVSGLADRAQALPGSVPSFVPARYRRTLLAAAMKWGVSAALLAAQLMAESGFDPGAVSSAGAQGIAQFMPATAASYGLRDPFDPIQAINAQAHLMSDLLKQFGGKPALALAAYNAGPGAVSPCDCIPGYPETQAYVAKILAMLGGIGAIAPMPMEIELVA